MRRTYRAVTVLAVAAATLTAGAAASAAAAGGAVGQPGKVAQAGKVTLHSTRVIYGPRAMVTGPDGALWYTNFIGNSIESLTGFPAERFIADPQFGASRIHPDDIKGAVRNNGGGHWNHSFFWKLMAPNAGGAPTGAVADAINSAFGDFEKFKTAVNTAGTTRFGRGWAWARTTAPR